MLYKLKQSIEAFKFTHRIAIGEEAAPEWFQEAVECGIIDIYNVEESYTLELRTTKGIETASKEDYIVQAANGEILILTEKEFSKVFEYVTL